jgi:hypothetical protein
MQYDDIDDVLEIICEALSKRNWLYKLLKITEADIRREEGPYLKFCAD